MVSWNQRIFQSQNHYLSAAFRTAFSISLKLRQQPFEERTEVGAKEDVPVRGEEDDEQREGDKKANTAVEAEETDNEPRRVVGGENESLKEEWRGKLGHAKSGLEHSFARIECQVVSGSAQASTCISPFGHLYQFPSLFVSKLSRLHRSPAMHVCEF
jgi:hypothetical protein